MTVESPDAAAPADGRRLLAAVFVAFFLAVVNFSAATPFYSKIARDLDTSVALLGQVTTVVTLLSAVAGLAIGPLADRYGHRHLVIGGVLAVAINLAGTGLAPSYQVLLLLAIIGGLGDAILFGLPLAIARGHFSGDARRKAFGITTAAIPAGTVVAVPIISVIGGAAGWRAVMVGVGVATFGAALVIAAWIPRDAKRPSEPLSLRSLAESYLPVLRDRGMIELYGVNGLRAASWVGSITYLGAFVADGFSYSSARVGLVYMATGVGVFVGSLSANGLLGRGRVRTIVGILSIVQGLLFGLVFAAPVGAGGAFVLLPLAGLAGSIAFVGVAALLADGSSGGSGTTMTLNGSVFNLGTAVGAAIGGVLIATGGYLALGIGLPAFAVAAGLLSLRRSTPIRDS